MLSWDQVMLLAQSSRLRALGSGVRGRRAQFDSGDLFTMVVVLAVFVVGLVVHSKLMSRQERRRSFTSPGELFRALVKAHGLDRSSRRLLRQIASYQRLAEPARLFLEPERFEPANLSVPLRARAAVVAALRDRLFTVPTAPPSPADTTTDPIAG